MAGARRWGKPRKQSQRAHLAATVVIHANESRMPPEGGILGSRGRHSGGLPNLYNTSAGHQHMASVSPSPKDQDMALVMVMLASSEKGVDMGTLKDQTHLEEPAVAHALLRCMKTGIVTKELRKIEGHNSPIVSKAFFTLSLSPSLHKILRELFPQTGRQ